MNDIQEVFDRYIDKLWPNGVSPTVRTMMEKTFFAGAALMLQAIGHMQSKTEHGDWQTLAPVTLQVGMFTEEIDSHGSWDEIREVLKEWSEKR